MVSRTAPCSFQSVVDNHSFQSEPHNLKYDSERTELRSFQLLLLSSNEYFDVTVLINPSCPEVEKEIKKFFGNATTGAPYVAYAGHGDDEGDWVLHDDHFTLDDSCVALVAGIESNSQFTSTSQYGEIYLNCCFGAKWASDFFISHAHLYDKDHNSILSRIRLLPTGEVKAIPIVGL